MVRARLHVMNERPTTRGECVDGPRPCPFVTCRHHLLVDVGADGRLLRSHDFDEEDEGSIADALCEMSETCSLDVAALGGADAERVGDLVGISREEVHRCIQGVGRQLSRDAFEECEHPEDFYLRYADTGADDLAEIAAELRRRDRMDFGHVFALDTERCKCCGITRKKAT